MYTIFNFFIGVGDLSGVTSFNKTNKLALARSAGHHTSY